MDARVPDNVLEDARLDAKRKAFHSIRFKIALLICLIVILLMALDSAWNTYIQNSQAQREALEKAQVLSCEMRAAWDFVDINQNQINRAPDGSFRTKTLVCVVASKSIALRFSDESDYTIRFTNENPRLKNSGVDKFEQEAIDAFRADPDLEAYYGVTVDEQTGSRVFRYVEPLYVTETCLECHGNPAGELDQFGYPKEGMDLGDIGGVMSIIEPMDIYYEGISNSVMQQVFMVLVLIVIACLGIFAITNRLILKPVEELDRAAKRIGSGDFDYKLPSLRGKPQGKGATPFVASDEIEEFTRSFDLMARQLESLYANLEHEVAKQTDELTALNAMLVDQKAELERANEQLSAESAYKNEFFAIVSHELRTPITSILAFAHMLKIAEGIDASALDSIVEIETNANILLNLVNNILTISRIEADREQFRTEPVDMVDLLGLVSRELAPLAANRQISFTALASENVPVFSADWEKLRRIIVNLADNAIKYTHVGGRVDVSATFEPENDLPIVIEVQDDGMGIAPEDIDGIFDLYHQASTMSPNRRYRGTGLGLAVVRNLTAMHGGEVSVISEVKVGSTFTVRLPYVEVPDDDDEE